MSTIAEVVRAGKPPLFVARLLGCLMVFFLPFDGAIRLVQWPAIAEALERTGVGLSETLERSLGIVTTACTALYAVPPTSILGAILWTGYIGGAVASHMRIDSPLLAHGLLGIYLGLMVCGGLWLRDARLREMLPSETEV